MDVDENLPGMEMRVKGMMNMIERGVAEDVLMLGICGLGGIGKTTLAKMIYNRLGPSFYYKSFIANIRETASTSCLGLVHLQKQLIAEISGEASTDIHNTSQGIEMVKRSLGNKKVLIILDDVDNVEQIDVLARIPSWFGQGSRIIITTRDMQVLSRKIRKDMIYETSGLNPDEALQLFSHHAFGKNEPDPENKEYSRTIVLMLGGLPLVLKVIGSHMFGFREETVPWEEMIDKLQQGQNKDVYQCLKISFDGLEKEEQKILVDTACFLIGKDKVEACYMWSACGFCPTMSLKRLEEKSLLKIDEDGKFQMHDLVRDMSRQIGEHSHIWKHEAALNVLENSEGSEQVEGIAVDCDIQKNVSLQTCSFNSMMKLRVLFLGGVTPPEVSFSSFPSKLKWLNWSHCGYEELPEKMDLKEVSVLQLKKSSFTQLWAEKKVLRNLKVLDLEGCQNLRMLPNLSSMTLLERLSLRGCKELVELPDSICMLKQLVVLDLCACSSIKSLPQGFGGLESLKLLILNDTQIPELPTSMERLIQLESLYWIPDLAVRNLNLENLLCIITSLKKLINLGLKPEINMIRKILYMLDQGQLPQLRALEFQSRMLNFDLSKKMKKNIPAIRSSNKANQAAPILEELVIYNPRTTSVGKEVIKLDPLPHMPFLSTLRISDIMDFRKIWNVDDDQMEDGTSPAPSLKKLTLQRCSGFKSLPYLPALETLKVKNCPNLKEIWEVKKNEDGSSSPAPSLQELTLKGYYGLRALPYLPSLQMLKLNTCPKLKQILEINSSPAPCLEELKLDGCYGLRSLPKFPSVKKLRLRDCQLLKVENLKLHYRELIELEVDASLQTYLMDVRPVLPRLERLHLKKWNIEQGDDQWVGEIINWLKKLPRLFILEIDNFDSITNIRGRWNELSNLHTLLITCANNLEDYSLAEVKEAPPPQLKKIQLRGSTCETITVLPDMPFLNRLHIFGFPHLKNLPETMPCLPNWNN